MKEFRLKFLLIFIGLCAITIDYNYEPKVDYDLVRKMRASFLVLGPLLAREGYAEVSLPGGCAIGTRPVDMHLYAMKKLGASISFSDGYVIAKSKLKGLVGEKIEFSKISVGATENTIMAAVLAKGETLIKNAAKEPEISDLCNCLNAMGAKIEGMGSNKIYIQGVTNLSSTLPLGAVSTSHCWQAFFYFRREDISGPMPRFVGPFFPQSNSLK